MILQWLLEEDMEPKVCEAIRVILEMDVWRKGWKGDDEKDRCKKDGKIKRISGQRMGWKLY